METMEMKQTRIGMRQENERERGWSERPDVLLVHHVGARLLRVIIGCIVGCTAGVSVVFATV